MAPIDKKTGNHIQLVPPGFTRHGQLLRNTLVDDVHAALENIRTQFYIRCVPFSPAVAWRMLDDLDQGRSSLPQQSPEQNSRLHAALGGIREELRVAVEGMPQLSKAEVPSADHQIEPPAVVAIQFRTQGQETSRRLREKRDRAHESVGNRIQKIYRGIGTKLEQEAQTMAAKGSSKQAARTFHMSKQIKTQAEEMGGQIPS